MLILGCDNKLYLFSHLSSFKKNIGQKVYIGDIVAEVGNTGYSNGAHLHVQLVKANSISAVFDTSANQLKSISSKSKNPFDYEDDYSNPVREELK